MFRKEHIWPIARAALVRALPAALGAAIGTLAALGVLDPELAEQLQRALYGW